MAIELITGYAGTGHVSSADAGRFNAGVCGSGKYVMDTGTKFAYSIESSNLIRIGSGDAVDQGRHISIPQNSYEDATIANGNQNKVRIDVIALRYTKNTSTGIESASLVVIKGTEVNTGSTPKAPSGTSGNIFNGAAKDDMPLYNVLIEGTQIESVTAVFKLMPSLSDMEIYPVGSIYMSTKSTNPSKYFGGTWQEVQGKFLLGRSSAHAAGSSGGAETVTLTKDQMPAHTHTGPAHTHTGPAHTHTTPAHSHTATCETAGLHNHKVNRHMVAATGNKKYASSSGDTHETNWAGAHTHKITIANGGGGVTGSSGTGATGSAGTGATSSVGGGKAVTIMPPFLSVYIWTRTA